MKRPIRTWLIAASCTLAACSGGTKNAAAPASETAAEAPAAKPGDPISSAMSAAPAAIGKAATIVSMSSQGAMETLRAGTNGWTCMPDNPATPGHDPMCMDTNATEWAMAWIGHKPPPVEKPGMMYMLEGGTDASNTDPYATAPTGGGDWLKTGPHLMLVGSSVALKGYPAGAKPDTAAPYVMWAGTPYAHLMIPVN